MLPYLPPDLVEEILSKVPATSLKRLRSTCKRWNALFKNQRFTEKHFREAAKQSRVLIFKDYMFCSMSLNVSPLSLEFKTAFSLKEPHSDSEQVDICEAFHCDGLLLCNTMDEKLVVWNPCLGETWWIQITKKKFSQYCLGYETKGSCRNYKVLRRWDDHEGDRLVSGFEVYEFSSDSWRSLDDVAIDFIIHTKRSSVSLNGNTYFLTFDSRVISFDYTTERFKLHCFPQTTTNWDYTALSVVRDEQLSVFCGSHLSSKIEIWLTNKIDSGNEDESLSWSKSFTVDSHIPRSDHSPIPMSFLINQQNKMVLYIIPLNKKEIAYIIEEDDDYYTEITDVDESTNQSLLWTFIFHYFPSLVRIQQAKKLVEVRL